MKSICGTCNHLATTKYVNNNANSEDETQTIRTWNQCLLGVIPCGKSKILECNKYREINEV